MKGNLFALLLTDEDSDRVRSGLEHYGEMRVKNDEEGAMPPKIHTARTPHLYINMHIEH
jgi:hypothetical protein